MVVRQNNHEAVRGKLVKSEDGIFHLRTEGVGGGTFRPFNDNGVVGERDSLSTDRHVATRGQKKEWIPHGDNVCGRMTRLANRILGR